MSDKLIFFLQRITRKTWWRCSLFACFAVAAVALASVLGPYIGRDVALKLGSDSIDSLLNILASSMLTVAIFSASTMVASFSAVSNSATPRAAQLLIEDTTIQNTLAVFIGAFVYSVIALVGLHAHIYGDGGRLVLFGFTLVVLVTVVIVFLRWIDYLSVLGRLGETIRRLEAATREAMDERLAKPFLGGRAQQDGERGSHEILCPGSGFVMHVSTDLLQARAEELGAELHVHVLPGDFVGPGMAIASCTKPLDEAARQKISDAFSIGPARTFDHDPRFGLVVLGEVAARSLSPAVNDPGTAFDVMATAVRVLSHWSQLRLRQDLAGPVQFDRVSAPAVREAGMVEDLFAPIARYGAAAVEVGETLQRALRSLCGTTGAVPTAARAMSAYAIVRAQHAGLPEVDLQRLRQLAAF